MAKTSNVAGVVGDPVFFKIAETNAIAELGKRGLQLNSIHRHDWGRAEKDARPESALTPPLMPGYGKIVIWKNPPIGVITKSVEQCNKYETMFLVLLFDGDTYDKRSKVLKELDASGQLHCIGLIKPNETQRYLSAMRMVARSEELMFDDAALKALSQLGHLVRRQVVTSGEKKGERLVHDLCRLRQEAIKAQFYAGWGNKVGIEHIREICSTSIVSDVWTVLDSMFSGNTAAILRAFDGCVDNIGDARKLLGLVKSQLELLAMVKGIMEQGPERDPREVAAKVRETSGIDRYEMWDSSSEKLSLTALDEYRAKKLMELRHTQIWTNCGEAIRICLNTHRDMVGTLGSSWTTVMTKMCLDICSLSK